MTLGDRVVVMKDGVMQQCASALDIYHHPANRFVAGFIGTPPMNFFEGRLVDEGGRLWFDEGTGRLPVPARATSALRARRRRRGRRSCSAFAPRRWRPRPRRASRRPARSWR